MVKDEKSTKSFNESVKRADRNSRKRELENDSQHKLSEELAKKRKDFEELHEALTGEKPGIYTKKKQNANVAFAQFIQHNVQTLTENGYLTTAQKAFLFDISGYIDFKTNIIVERDYKNTNKKDKNVNEIPKAATVTYVSSLIGIGRQRTSELMNSLKDKGILGTAETGMTTEDGRVCSSRTWFVNPNVMYCGDKSDIDRTVQFIFKDALKNMVGKDNKKFKLPIRLFL